MAFGGNRPNVVIDIPADTTEDPAPFLDETGRDSSPFLEFKYEQPSITVNSSARFAEHQPVSEVTVRQKLGEGADQISMNGVCTVEEANKVDKLVSFDYVDIVSNRWEGRAYVASANTDPLADGGSQDKDEEWLHTFTVELVEVTRV